MMDFFAGANQGTATSNLNTVVISAYLKDSGDTQNYIVSLLSVSQLIGAIIGSFSCSFLLDKMGPKWLTLVSGFSAAVFHALCMIRVHWGYLLAMRILMGIPSSIISTVVPAWISSIATVKQRGILGVFFQLFICAGIIFAALILFAITVSDK